MRRLRGWLRSPVALAISGFSLVAAPSCARSTPTGPDSVVLADAQPSSTPTPPGIVGTMASSALARKLGTSFDLSDGAFELTTSDGDTLDGRYTGTVEITGSGKRSTASLDLHVEGGTGAFIGASGTLRGEGKGALINDGSFWLSLDGQLSTAEGSALQFRAVVRGTSQLSCVDNRVQATLVGTGSARRFRRVELELSHLLENAGCSS